MVKFLVIRFSSIGDIVLTSPVVRRLKQSVEDAEIHFLVKPAFKSIVDSNPNIDKVHVFEERLSDTLRTLEDEGFDYVIDLQNNARSGQVKRSLKRMYFTVNKLNLRKWLYVNFKINKLPEKHIVDRYLETIHVFDEAEDNGGLDFFIPEEEHVSLVTLPVEFREGYIALAIGAAHETKKMPVPLLTELVAKLHKPVVLIGGPGDKDNAESIILDNPTARIFNACGRYSINQSASLIEQSSCVITHDTGMMHIAAAFHKKIISIWGNTVPAFGMYPYKAHPDSVICEVEGLKCRPCSKIGSVSCPKKHFRCMMDQDVERIAELAEHFLHNRI